MQQVIELGRGIRDQAKRPLKVPLRSLVVVHTDKSFLEEIAGSAAGHANSTKHKMSMYVACHEINNLAASFLPMIHTTAALVHAGRRIAGELREYVVEELNVRALETCDKPLQYAQLRAEPDWKVTRSCYWSKTVST
jgi:hypothetical protein